MKRILCHVLVVGLLLVALSSFVQAQLDPAQRKAEIPFSFYVEDKEFPAGTYLVGWLNGRLQIQSLDGSYRVAVIALPVESNKTAQTSVLQFNRYGDIRCLSRIWIAGRNLGHELLQGKTELKIARMRNHRTDVEVRLEAMR